MRHSSFFATFTGVVLRHPQRRRRQTFLRILGLHVAQEDHVGLTDVGHPRRVRERVEQKVGENEGLESDLGKSDLLRRLRLVQSAPLRHLLWKF